LLYASHSTQGVTRYVYLGPKLIAEVNSLTGTGFSHTDALGSPVARTSAGASPTILSRTRYEPYGATAAGTNPNGIGFTGHVNDTDTGLVYMQQRYYEPIAGRFLSVDPVVTDAQTAGHFNRYAYGNDSPFRYVDPDGSYSIAVEACLGWCAGFSAGYSRASTEIAVTGSLGAGRGGGLMLDLRPNENGRFGSVPSDTHSGIQGGVYSKISLEAGTPLGAYATGPKIFTGVNSHTGLVSALEQEQGFSPPGEKFGLKAVSSGGLEVAAYVNASKVVGDVRSFVESAVRQTSTGFRGVFRVSGRLESRALEKELAQ
jgi:RHS repeat-associated protein